MCVCVCVYVCVFVCVLDCLSVHTYVCLHVLHACMYSPAQPTHSGSLASCLCEEEEVLDWFHDLNAMKYCKQFVEKVPRGNYTCVFAHAHTQHTHGTILL